MTLEIEPITPTLGAHIRSSCDVVLNGDGPEQVLAALNTYNVIVFPQIHMTDDQFLKLSGMLGDLRQEDVTKDGSSVSDKGLYRIALDKDDKTQRDFVKGNDYWHMDGTSYDVPGKATMLKCENAPSEGGDTGIANLFAAYEALSEDEKDQLENLRAVHCLSSVGVKMYDNPTAGDFARWDAVFPPREHPLVWHQHDGRTALIIGSTARDIVGMDHEEGAALLDKLLSWCTSDRFTYRHRWQQGDVLMFNNPGVLHRSYPYNEASGRLMLRTTLKGMEAIG